MKQRMIQLALWAGVIGMAVLIFAMSAQNGEASTASSDTFVLPLLNLLDRLFDLTEASRESLYWTLQLIVRKIAHISEYALLAFLIRILAMSYRAHRPGMIGWLIAVVYAATDELHQFFIGGRSSQFTDVLVDAFGALLGVAAAWAVARFIASTHHAKEEP
ncbi:MAG: VanZ family protein [Aristaeellaceae bacterium]